MKILRKWFFDSKKEKREILKKIKLRRGYALLVDKECCGYVYMIEHKYK